MKPLLVTACLFLSSAHALAQPSAAILPDAPSPAAGYSYHPSTGDQPPPVDLPTDTGRRTGAVWVLRGGTFSGAGKAAAECEGDSCPEMPPAEGYDERAATVLSADWLLHGSRNVRFGFGTQLIPTLTTQLNGERYELGSVFGTDFVVEGVFDLSPKIALTLRGSAGMSLLFPTGELQDAADANSDACYQFEDCESDPGPYFGAQAGAGAGLLYNLGTVGLRVDFQVQAYTFRTMETKVPGTEAAVSFSGLRPMVLAGIEL